MQVDFLIPRARCAGQKGEERYLVIWDQYRGATEFTFCSSAVIAPHLGNIAAYQVPRPSLCHSGSQGSTLRDMWGRG